MAARRKRSQAARRAAEQRARAKRTAERSRRSKAAKAAAEQRARAKRTQERKKRSEASKLGWGKRQVNARLVALGNAFRIDGRGGYLKWSRMNDMIRNNDKRWLKYYEFMRRAGFSSRRIYDEWFSPSFL